MTPMNTCRYWLGHVDTYEAICLDGPSEPAAACMQHAEIREFGEDYELGGGRHAVPLHTTADMSCGLWRAGAARPARRTGGTTAASCGRSRTPSPARRTHER